MRFVVVTFVVAAALPPGVAGATGQTADRQPAAGPAIVRVFVHTDETGEPTELAARQASAKDLIAALTSKKKSFVVVTKEDAADLDVEVIIRGLTVPKFVIGIGARPGDPPGGNAPLKVAVLRVRLTRGEVATDFTNKNKPGDTPRGWKSAADDIVDQIEKWIRAGAPRDGGTRHRLRPSRSSTATP